VRTLLIRPGAIGDFILSLPALECLRGGYTEVWCAGPNVPLARLADRAAPVAGSGLDWLGIPETEPPPALLDRLRSFDRIISWYGAAQALFRQRVAALGLPFTFFSALPPEGGVHAADYYLAQARSIQPCSRPPEPRLPVPPVPRERFAVIHPFASQPRKRWPFVRFQELGRLLEQAGLPVCYCAGPEEPLAGAVRFGNLWDLACWLARAAVFVGNDSGITHLAAAAGTPAVALFGPTDPRVWAPRGVRVRVLDRMEDRTAAEAAAQALALTN
jgi:heptosyltransferase-3